jgi:hypothetical protein
LFEPSHAPDAALLPTYRRLVRQALDACGAYCWNVWGLTGYDFNLYPLDDAQLMAQQGVASVFTEYGFTRGSATDMERRFGGDARVAIQRGLGRTWQDVDGVTHPYLYSASDLVLSGLAAGISPWGAPAPGPLAALDADGQRGVTKLEAANQAAGVSAACLATVSIR